jgi:hypothetical protein
MGRTKSPGFPYGLEVGRVVRHEPHAREIWMARHAVPGGIVTAVVLGVSAGFAFGLSSWWLGLVVGILYAAVGVGLWAAAVRKVGRWHREQREAARRLASYLGESPPPRPPLGSPPVV